MCWWRRFSTGNNTRRFGPGYVGGGGDFVDGGEEGGGFYSAKARGSELGLPELGSLTLCTIRARPARVRVAHTLYD